MYAADEQALRPFVWFRLLGSGMPLIGMTVMLLWASRCAVCAGLFIHGVLKGTIPPRQEGIPSRNPPTETADGVSYLRVSSKGQVNTDYNLQGISLPAQREACHGGVRELETAITEPSTRQRRGHQIQDGRKSQKRRNHHPRQALIVPTYSSGYRRSSTRSAARRGNPTPSP
jgi:hypothetical protein